MRRAARALLVAVTLGVIVFLFVLPGRIWLAQERATSTAQRQEAALSQENAALAKQVAQLQNTAYIERYARQQYGLVLPGERAYAILVPATPPTSVAPAPKSQHHHSIWRTLEFWN